MSEVDGSGAATGYSWQGTTSFAGYSGLMAVITLPDAGINTANTVIGPRIDYTLNFKSTGTYYVYVLGRAGSGVTNSDSIHAGLDGAAVTLAGTGFMGWDTAGNWSWQDSYNNTRVILTVNTTGPHTLNIWMREDGMVVDRIAISQDSGITNSELNALNTSVGWTAACGGATIPTSTNTPTLTATPTLVPTDTPTPTGTPTPTPTGQIG